MSLLHRAVILLLDGVVIVAWFIGIAAAAGVIYLFLTLPSWAVTCRHEPGDSSSWTWRNVDGQRCWYEGRRVLSKDQLHWLEREVKQDAEYGRLPIHSTDKTMPAPEPSWLERVSDKAPPAEIYFPTMTPGNMLDAYQPLIWQQPWLTPDTIIHWPLLLDVDRKPFTAWTKRIGQ